MTYSIFGCDLSPASASTTSGSPTRPTGAARRRDRDIALAEALSSRTIPQLAPSEAGPSGDLDQAGRPASEAATASTLLDVYATIARRASR
jgi:hypothetical protein